MNIKAARSISYQKNALPLVTMKDLEEVRLRLKNKVAINTSPPPPSSLASSSPSLFSHQDKIAHWRLAFILALKEEISQKTRLRRDIINEILGRYNSGPLLPEIFKNLKKVSWQTLYRWMKAFNDYGIDGLIPQYGGEGNSKVTDHEKNFLLALLLNPNCLKVAYAIKLLKNRFKNIRIESPSSPRTLRRFVDEFKTKHGDLWELARKGEKALDDNFLPFIPRDRNFLEVGDVLVADGHRMNLQVINPFTGDPCRPVIIFFIDWRSSYPLGWEIMLEEDVQCIASATRNAILTLGKIPKLIYVDNGRAFRARFFTSKVNLTDTEIAGMFARLGILVKFTSPYNAKAKINERFHRTLNDQFERLFSSYTGPSIEDKPVWTKRNEKLARSLHSDRIPKIYEVNENLSKFLEFYVDQPSRGLNGQTPREIFNAGKGPGIDPKDLYDQMLERKIKNIHRNGFTIFGCDWNDDALYGYREPVLIKYSLFDLSQIYVFTIKGDPLCVVKPVPRIHPMAHELGAPKDMEEVKRGNARKRKLKSQTVEIYRLLGHKSAEILPLKEIVEEVPNVLKAIEKIDAEKTSQEKRWPLPGEPDSQKPVLEDVDSNKIDMAADHGSPLDGPFFETEEKWYEWAIKQDPETLNEASREKITEYENSGHYEKIFGDESGQRYLDRIKFKRIAGGKPILEGEENERPICAN
jgi:putative transposase